MDFPLEIFMNDWKVRPILMFVWHNLKIIFLERVKNICYDIYLFIQWKNWTARKRFLWAIEKVRYILMFVQHNLKIIFWEQVKNFWYSTFLLKSSQ